MELDRIDYEILRLLSKNVRISNKELASAIALAPSTCHERLKRLHKRAVLAGAHAEINLNAIGLHVQALLFVELTRHHREAVDRLMTEIETIPEVRRAFVITGRYDLVVHVAVRDTDHLRALEYDRFTNRPLVSRVETSIIFESRGRYELPLPLEAERSRSGRAAARARRRT